MHNSQNGAPILRSGSGVGWNSSSVLEGGEIQEEPSGYLLNTTCVGCHSATTESTIIEMGGSRIPIVLNTTGYPPNSLAGGNFYWTTQGDAYAGYGHNVYGVAGPDPKLSMAPGRDMGCANNLSCHMTLAAPPHPQHNDNRGGCQGCHYSVFHHTDNGVYRFLIGHTQEARYVSGIEDPDWEQAPAASHNSYKGVAGPVAGSVLTHTHSISAYCGGCHPDFHRQNDIGSSTPWLRHPSDILLPETSEYVGYNPVTNYQAEAPVAWTNPAAPVRSQAVVMCLSCHRPHGSPYPDLLRWDYNNMIAHAPPAGSENTGCFTCHTAKDD